MEWNNYLKTNKPGESDCQLVVAVNAYYHLTGKIIDQKGEFYDKLRKDSGCEAGSCIDITQAWKQLGIWEDKKISEHKVDKYLKKNCFIEAKVWHKFFGFHCISIVDYIKMCDVVRVTNFRHVASTSGWIFREDLKPFLNPNKTKPGYHFRTFKIQKITK